MRAIDVRRVKMKKRILAAVVYVITAVALAGYFDGVYGGEPITRHLGLIHTATAGATLFAVACLLSLFTLRFGVICGLVASILAWPFFGPIMVAIPWGRILQMLPYARWADTLAAILMLTISSIYSLAQLRSLFRSPAAR